MIISDILYSVKGTIKSVFVGGDERSVKVRTNITTSFIVRILSILISFLLVPLTISYVNEERYGIWLILSSIVSWLGYFDIGFGNGLRNRFAEAVAKGDHAKARVYVSTTYAILALIVFAVAVLYFIASPLLNWATICAVGPEMRHELDVLAMVVIVFFCIQLVLQLLNTIVTANQEPAKGSVISFLGNLLSLIIIFILTKTTQGSLINLGIALSLSPIIILVVASMVLFCGKYKLYAPSIKLVNFAYTKDLMTLGLKFFVIQIAVLMMYQTSNLIIGQLFGPTNVTVYGVAYKYFGAVPMFVNIITMTYWSAITDAWVKKDISWIKSSMNKLILLWIAVVVGVVIMVLVSNIFFKIWVGEEIIVPMTLSITLAVYVIVNVWNNIFTIFLNGVGKIKLQYYSCIWCMVLNIPMAVFLGKRVGIEGVILASVVLGFVNMVWSYIQYKKIISFKAKGIWDK